MRHRLLPALLVALIFLAQAPSVRHALAAITVKGKVTYATTPVSGVEISVLTTTSPATSVASAVTDEQGNFNLAGIGTGTYRLVTTRVPDGFIRYPFSEERFVNVTASSTDDQQYTLNLLRAISTRSPSPQQKMAQGSSVQLSWEPGPAEATHFGIYVQSSALNLSTDLIDAATTTPGSYTIQTPLCLGTAQWGVKAYMVAPGTGPIPVGQTVGSDDRHRYQTFDVVPTSTEARPAPNSPVCGATVPQGRTGVEAVRLSWATVGLPADLTQYQLQVVPYNGDGPALNLIRTFEGGFTISGPQLGQGNYFLLPDMTYHWRLRVSNAAASIGEDDPSWGQWSDWSLFRTSNPKGSAGSPTLTPMNPAQGGTATSLTPTLQWSDSDKSIWYYEVQLSTDFRFVTDPARATAAVYWNLVHAAVTEPPSSWTVPATAALSPKTTYYWRVRPRLQGDTAIYNPWSDTASFKTP